METESQRRNRELIELLNELRVILPGVQVLFAFLLVVPFSAAFDDLSSIGRDLYVVTLLLTVLASVILTTPSAYHRFVFRRHDKEELLEISNALALVGLTVLALAMNCAIFVITDFIWGTTGAAIITGVAAVVFAAFWYALPLQRRARRRADWPPDEEDDVVEVVETAEAPEAPPALAPPAP